MLHESPGRLVLGGDVVSSSFVADDFSVLMRLEKLQSRVVWVAELSALLEVAGLIHDISIGQLRPRDCAVAT